MGKIKKNPSRFYIKIKYLQFFAILIDFSVVSLGNKLLFNKKKLVKV